MTEVNTTYKRSEAVGDIDGLEQQHVVQSLIQNSEAVGSTA